MNKNIALGRKGAYLTKVKGGANRGGVHKNKKREASRNFCRKG